MDFRRSLIKYVKVFGGSEDHGLNMFQRILDETCMNILKRILDDRDLNVGRPLD